MITIPKRFENAEYGEIRKDVTDKFSRIRETRKGLYIFGPVGSGKTYMAIALKKEWDKRSLYKSYFFNTSELLQEIRDDFDRPNTDKSNIFNKIMDSKRLIFLDDLGAEVPTNWVLERLYMIINKRYNDMLPMIITSNYSVEKLAEKVGDRIVSRIVEMCDVVKLTGEDKRLKS